MDTTTLVLSVGGCVFGAIGAIAAAVALYYAHLAKRASGQSNDLAEGSNTIALDARRIALEANEYSRRAEDRDTERHDVYWEGGWIAKGVYRLYKRGDDAAHDIVATVTVDREEQTATGPLLREEHSWLDFHFPGAAAQRDLEAAEDAEAKRRDATDEEKARQRGWPLAAVGLSRPPVRFEAITERVVWTTDRGTPKTHTDESRGLRH